MPAVRHALKKVENNLSQTLAEEAILNKKKESRKSSPAACSIRCLESLVLVEEDLRDAAEGRGWAEGRGRHRGPSSGKDPRPTLPSAVQASLSLVSCGRLASAEGGARRPRGSLALSRVAVREDSGSERRRGLDLLSRRGHPACRPVNL